MLGCDEVPDFFRSAAQSYPLDSPRDTSLILFLS